MNASEDRDVVRLNATNLRGVAHPIRVRILGMLRIDGPATATGLAQRLGMNSGATSYHLRQLAEHGFVVEDPDRGVGRERWWKAAHNTTRFDAEGQTAEGLESGVTYVRAVAQSYAEQLLRAADELDTRPKSWRTAGTFSSFLLKLTPEELRSLDEEITAVIRRYRSALPEPDDAPDDSARVTFQWQSFPHLEDVPFEGDES